MGFVSISIYCLSVNRHMECPISDGPHTVQGLLPDKPCELDEVFSPFFSLILKY